MEESCLSRAAGSRRCICRAATSVWRTTTCACKAGISARPAAGSASQRAGVSGGATASMPLLYCVAPHPATPRLSRDVGDVNAYGIYISMPLIRIKCADWWAYVERKVIAPSRDVVIVNELKLIARGRWAAAVVGLN